MFSLHLFNSVNMCYCACLKHLMVLIARPIARQGWQAETIKNEKTVRRRKGAVGASHSVSHKVRVKVSLQKRKEKAQRLKVVGII